MSNIEKISRLAIENGFEDDGVLKRKDIFKRKLVKFSRKTGCECHLYLTKDSIVFKEFFSLNETDYCRLSVGYINKNYASVVDYIFKNYIDEKETKI